DRLRELRVGMSLREYREFTGALEREQAVLAGVQAGGAGATRHTGGVEQALRELGWEGSRGEGGVRGPGGEMGGGRQQIAGFDATLRHERNNAAGFETELLKIGRQRAELGYRTKAIEAEASRATAEATAAEERLTEKRHAAEEADEALASATRRAAEL